MRSGRDAAAPTDDETNRLLARSEEEFELFQRMDAEIDAEDEAAWCAALGNKGKSWPGRILTEAELPAHVKQGELVQKLEEEDAMSDGPLPRRRAAAAVAASAINSADALTEREWMRCLERGLNPVENAQRKLSADAHPAPSQAAIVEDACECSAGHASQAASSNNNPR